MREPDEGFWLESDDDRLRRRMYGNTAQSTANPAPSKNDNKQAFIFTQLRSGFVRIFNVVKGRSVSTALSIRSKTPRLPRKGWVIIGAIVLMIGVSGTVLSWESNRSTDVATEVLGDENSKMPEFKPATPARTESQASVKYDTEKKVVNFADKIDGVDITVSQQEMPEGFKDDPAESVRKLAEQFSANEKITADGGMTAYIGTSAKGPQSVVTYKGGLLIFIYSKSKISNHSWGNYVAQLR